MNKRNSGFTLAEVVTAIGIVAMIFGGMMVAYTQATRRAQWSGYSMAAQGLAIQQLEQARSAQWDPCASEG
jgi:type II secretory pathway pseudopilin PulG